MSDIKTKKERLVLVGQKPRGIAGESLAKLTAAGFYLSTQAKSANWALCKQLSEKHPQKIKDPKWTHQCVRDASFPRSDAPLDAICGYLFRIDQLPSGGFSTSKVVKHNKIVHGMIS